MKVKVRAFAIESENVDLAGIASISFGDTFFIRSITIMKGKDGKNFVSFPSLKVGEGYKEVCNPINKEYRQKLVDAIFTSMEKKECVEFDDGHGSDITVRAYPCESDGKKVGEAKVYINNDFVISGISIYEIYNKQLYPGMPSYKTLDCKPNGSLIYEPFCSVRKGMQKTLRQIIISEYLQAKKEQNNERISIRGKLCESKDKVADRNGKPCKNEELEK